MGACGSWNSTKYALPLVSEGSSIVRKLRFRKTNLPVTQCMICSYHLHTFWMKLQVNTPCILSIWHCEGATRPVTKTTMQFATYSSPADPRRVNGRPSCCGCNHVKTFKGAFHTGELCFDQLRVQGADSTPWEPPSGNFKKQTPYFRGRIGWDPSGIDDPLSW